MTRQRNNFTLSFDIKNVFEFFVLIGDTLHLVISAPFHVSTKHLKSKSCAHDE